MSSLPRQPIDLARSFARRRSLERRDDMQGEAAVWRRETFRQPREQARETTRDWFERYPKAAYLTAVESWRVLDDGLIEFTMRRLPSAD